MHLYIQYIEIGTNDYLDKETNLIKTGLKGLNICDYMVTSQTNIFNVTLGADSKMIIKNAGPETPTSVSNGNYVGPKIKFREILLDSSRKKTENERFQAL